MTQPLRGLPSVERVLQALGQNPLPRSLVVAVVRKELASLRARKEVPPFAAVLRSIWSSLQGLERTRLQPVINGTGILIHTNLGRAPLGQDVIDAVTSAATQYNNLEFDLLSGERGGRADYLESNLALLCGAEAATVVNNCAAALVLVLRHLVKQKPEVVISRGELIQIGGGFRIPEILEASGARLREIGTTNKTSLQDYADAIRPETGLILKIHRSNFYMGGFVESPGTAAIAALAQKNRCPFVEDLGSGAIVATEKVEGLEHEPTPAEVLRQGANLVTFSGDKLFGGPQSGMIAGLGTLIAGLKREPFFRALRCDKLILAALERTIHLYLEGFPERTIPILRMLHTSEEELRVRAAHINAALNTTGLHAKIGAGRAHIGGGTMPRAALTSITVDLQPTQSALDAFAAQLRAGSPPVIGYISEGRFKLDLRTIFPHQDHSLIEAILARVQKRP